nr:hypothetical protein [Tanacetum cinerariifolium]
MRMPMLATAHAMIDVFDKKIFLEEIDEPRNIEELHMSDDINGDLGSFLKDNDLLADLESYDTMSLSPPISARLNNDSSGINCNPNSNSSISLDDFVKMDDSYTSIHQREEHGRMMLDSIDNGILVYPTVEENGQTRPKKYSELTKAQQLQDDCNVQATNIILHDLPPDVMNMQQVQVNTKFLNALPLEWSKFVTDVKLAKSLYTTKYDQLYAYRSQHERHANQFCITRKRYSDPLAFLANSLALFNPSQSPQLSALRFPPLNNQLRTSSNPRNQATIQDGRVIVQQVQRRQNQSYAGIEHRVIATTSKGNIAAGQQRVMKCYNYQGEGHTDRKYLNVQLQEKVFNTAVLKPNATVAPRMFKLDIEPISPRLKNNRDAHERKNIKKDGYTCFQRQEQDEHVGLEVTRSQEGKRSQDDDKRLCLVDDLKEVLNNIHIKSKPKVNDYCINSKVKD